MRRLFARAETFAPHALLAGAFIWLMAGLLFGQFFYPSQGPDGSFYAGLSVDSLTDAEAQEYRQTARLILGACVLAACMQGVVAWLYRSHRIARWTTAGIGGCYAVLSAACVAADSFLDHDTFAFFVYAGITGALSVPMLGAIARTSLAAPSDTGTSTPRE
jgi:hypothetical protein